MKTFYSNFYSYLISGVNRLVYQEVVQKQKIEKPADAPSEVRATPQEQAKEAADKAMKAVNDLPQGSVSSEKYFQHMEQRYKDMVKESTTGISGEPEKARTVGVKTDLDVERLVSAIQQLAEEGKLNANELAELDKISVSDIQGYLNMSRELNYKLGKIEIRIKEGALSPKDMNIGKWKNAVSIEDKKTAIGEMDKALAADKESHKRSADELHAVEDDSSDPLNGII
jgi:hypothetical protein